MRQSVRFSLEAIMERVLLACAGVPLLVVLILVAL